MRKAAEAGDDVVVMLGPAVVGFALHPGLEQFHLPGLIGAVLRMLQRQIEEPPDVARNLQVVPGLQRLLCEKPRQRIRSEGMARAPEGVARKLVQQDQQAQRALRRLRPGIQRPPGSGMVCDLEPFPEQGVESLVPGEPLRGSGLFPEGEDVGRRYVWLHESDPKRPAPRLP